MVGLIEQRLLTHLMTWSSPTLKFSVSGTTYIHSLSFYRNATTALAKEFVQSIIEALYSMPACTFKRQGSL